MSQPPKTPPSAKHNLQFQTPERSSQHLRFVHDGNEDQQFTLPLDATSTSFSPSKARAQARHNHQLTILKSWLTSLLPETANGKVNPLVARWETEYLNLSASKPATAAEMLKALQSLMMANQSTDERNRLLYAAKREELGLRTRPRRLGYARESINIICDSLPPSAGEALDSLAQTSVSLGLIPLTASQLTIGHEIGTAVIQQTVDSQIMSDQLIALSSLKCDLEANVEAARKQLQEMHNEKMSESASAERMQSQTAQWSREMKQVSVKVQEYKDRIATLGRTKPACDGIDMIKISDVSEMRERVRRRRELVTELEERVRAFHGLPPDLAASRQEVKRARADLERLKEKREEIFEHITGQ